MNNKTGELIEKHRKEKGLTQNELAKMLGVSNTAVSKWEHGNNLPDITLLEPLSEILGIDKLVLFTSENESKEETSERLKQIKRKNKINILIISIFFIISIVFTNYISYKIYKHKLDTIEESETSIYQFHSTDKEYIAAGYIIQGKEDTTIIFEQLEYQTIYSKVNKSIKKSNEYKDIKLVEFYIYSKEELLYSSFCKQEKDKNLSLNDFFQILTNQNIKSEIKLKQKNLNNITIFIKIDTSKEHIEKEIKIEI